MKFCSNCGKEMKKDSAFCSNCGTKANSDQNVNAQTVNVNQNTNMNNSSQPKSKVAAGILAIVVGYFGIHNFYLGYTNKAIAQLLITVLSCFILTPVTAIWSFVEGIMLLTGAINVDGQGNPLGE